MNKRSRNSNSCSERDLAGSIKSFLCFWGPPIALINIGPMVIKALGWTPTISGILWCVGIFWMSFSCLRNALRCGRFHCSVISVVYPILGLLALGITFGFVSLQWAVFWDFIFWPVTIIAFVPEWFGLKYIRKVQKVT